MTELSTRAAALVTAGNSPGLTRARHRAAVTDALAALDRFCTEAEGGAELALLAEDLRLAAVDALGGRFTGKADLPELRAEDLRLAAGAIGSIVGAVDVEDVLDRIFATFCIGK